MAKTVTMTEQDWLEGANPARMVSFLRERRVGDRKLRLFGCACCRRVWSLLPDDASRHAVEVAERFADKLARRKDMNNAHLACGKTPHNPAISVVRISTQMAAFWTSYSARCLAPGYTSFDASQIQAYHAATELEGRSQVKLLHDIFGNPFRPISVSRPWQTPRVLSLSQALYDNRPLPSGTLDPEQLTVLADALEEAGCDNADILGHLRGPGPHTRGCWVVDLLLDRE
jgi:hypothetical protein